MTDPKAVDMAGPDEEAIEAVGNALRIHDAAQQMNREYGVEVFGAPARGFIAALAAQEPAFVLVPRRSRFSRLLRRLGVGR